MVPHEPSINNLSGTVYWTDVKYSFWNTVWQYDGDVLEITFQ